MKKFTFIRGRYLALLLFFSLLSFSSLKATHIMGADITYFCTGPNQYQVTLTLFRDCAGILPISTQTVNFSSAICGVNSSLVLTQPSFPIDVTPLCPSQTSACAGGNVQFGIEQYTYTGTLSLPNGCGDDWVLSWKNCCRNYAITTLANPGNQSIYVEASLDNTLNPCNNSPVFNNIPTPIVCVNQPVIYNHGVTDPDGDQLVFSLVNCQQDNNQNVIYGAGFNATTPLVTAAGVTVNNTTGEITFTPNQVQIGVICVLVEEFRGGVKIGETVRDMQFSVISCTNTPPVATGVNGSVNDFDIDICIGQNFCFDINMSDADGDNVFGFWNNGIPSGTFTIANNNTTAPVGTFCWQPTPADAGTYFFTVSVQDDNCPLTASATYAFTVNVTTTSNAITTGGDQSICEGQSVNLTAFGAGATSYNWSPATGLSNSTIANPIASPTVTTTYTVIADFPNGCSAEDYVTVTVNPLPSLSVSPPVAYTCPGANVTLTANAPTATNFNWSSGGGAANEIVSPAATTTYTVNVSDANGCQATASTTVNVAQPGSGQCNVIYVTPTGTGAGTQANPASLTDAINQANCTDLVIKMATGTYNIDNAITNIQGNLTLEGGFIVGSNWDKTSTPGATTILRSAANPVGAANADRISAFEITAASNFRFQDLTIQTANATTAGTSNYGVHLTNCSDYDFVRVQVITGAAGAGAAGTAGATGGNGGNGGAGAAGSDNIQANAGDGGNGGAGAGANGGAAGAGGLDPVTAASCCSNFAGQVGEQRGCCGAGNDGADGTASTDYRSGGAGGGGGSGGEADNSGGDGGRGALPNNGGTAFNLGFGGAGDGGCSAQSGDNGTNAVAGADGANGTVGANGPAGAHAVGLWVPGAAAGVGTDGQGGAGGGGGGGGGGEGCGACCNDGAGSGGGGGGGGGEGGAGGSGGLGGGSSYGVYLFNNGANTNFRDCNINAGTAGAGGAGGVGGNGGNGGNAGLGSTYGSAGGINIGAGGNGAAGGDGGNGGQGGTGAAGQSQALFQSGGTAPATSITNFNLAAQQTITMSNVSCTNTNATFSGPFVNAFWDFGAGATPATATGFILQAEYNTTGRKDIIRGADQYAGFANIIVENTLEPLATTNAPLMGGNYVICAGSTIDFSAINGATGYVYFWDLDGAATPNTYTGTTFQSLNNVTFNFPGTYDIQLQYQTDCCGLTQADTVTITVEQQPAVTVPDDAFCAGTGGVTLAAVGAAASYNWAPSTGLSSNTGNSVVANPTSTTTYTMTAFNASGLCYNVDNVTVTVNDLNLNTSTVAQGCLPDGQANVVPTGGSGNYSYQWQTTPVQTASTATGLMTGTYEVIVTDLVTGCVDSVSTLVSASPATLNSLIINTVNADCNGQANGTATVAVTGGSNNYTYAWSPVGGNLATATGLAAGTYDVMITDNTTGCTTTSQAVIAEPAPLAVSLLSSTESDCNTFGDISVNASGGNGPFDYQWNTALNDTLNTLDSLGPGTYTVTVTDQSGCVENLPVTINGPQSPVILTPVNQTDASTCVASDGTITVSGAGSGGNITYTWDNGQTGPTANNLTPGSYTVTATGSNGCTDVLGFTLGPVCPLPVDWLGFAAEAEESAIRLDWTTLAEYDNNGFWIERSLDAENFERLDWKASEAISGGGAAYRYFDLDAIPQQLYYYRLEQVDRSGQSYFSEIKSAKLLADRALSIIDVYPVPTKNWVYVDIFSQEAQKLELILTNALGQRVKSINLFVEPGSNQVEISMEELASGMYIATFESLNGTHSECKIIKE
ncbi:MAG: T9SS type A sorting domain-containing protein [Bacteroidota bacterium]